MATFEVQVEALTGLSITGSTNPTQDELSQFLKDGVIDVTSKTIALDPKTKLEFSRESNSQSSNGVDFDGADIIAVVRESGVANQWEECRFINPSRQYKVTNTESLDYASKFNPAYTILDNGQVSVFPTPNGTNEHFKVYYVNNDPKDQTGNAALVYSHSDIKYFPSDKVYLVALYAAIKSLQNALPAKDSLLPEKPIFISPVLETITSMTLPSVPAMPVLSNNSVTFNETAPTFTEPVATLDFADANTWLNTEEDSEMVASRVQIISAQLQEYNTNLQKSVQSMNKENLEYQAILQKAIQDAQLSSQDDAQKLQLYSAQIQEYQAQVQKEVQRWANEEYNKKFNKWSKEFDGKLSEFNANIQSYNAQVTKVNAEYGWMEKRMIKLQQEYDSAFALMAPKQQQLQRERG